MPKRARWREELQLGLMVVLLVPVILVLIPFAALWMPLSERLRRCPNCGRRGTLQDVTPPLRREGWDGQPPLRLRRERIVIDHQLVCRRCGARFSEKSGEAPVRLPETQELSTGPVDNS